MATYRRNKSGATQTECQSNSVSPASSVGLASTNNNAPMHGTVVPNRIFVGGISSNTTESELSQLFSKYGNVKATKIIVDRAGVSKGYGFITFDNEEDVRCIIQNNGNIVLKERRLNIAEAVKKQPSFSRPFEAPSSPPAPTNLFHFHNGVPYTFHNGMAFFPQTATQPALAALPPSVDPQMYPTFGATQNAAPAPYGTQVLVPTPTPVFMSQNFPYQPLPMANGASTQFIYSGTASTSGSGSPMAGTPDNPSLPTPLAHQYYTHPFIHQEAYYQHQATAMFLVPFNSEYDVHEQQTVDGCSSTASTPHSDISGRSSNRSPGHFPGNIQFMNNNTEVVSGLQTDPSSNELIGNKQSQPNTDNQVPVVSWQNLQNHAERELYIRNGRRGFYRTGPPPSSRGPTQMLYYHQTQYQASFHSRGYTTAKQNQFENSYAQKHRGHPRSSASTNSVPFIPKFPDSFNNSNLLTMNNNNHEKKMGDGSNGKPQRLMNSRLRGNNRGSCNGSPPPSNPNPYSYESCPSPQVQQYYERQYVAPRWHPNPQAKRMQFSKRTNGSTSNMAVTTTNNIRLAKKPQVHMDSDLGGGGDAQPAAQLALTHTRSQTPDLDSETTSKMQSLSLETSN